MEKIKSLVVGLLNRATAAYLRRGNVRIIAVAGSIGKTSTASAIRTVLAQKYRVHQPQTAYNTNKSVHLEIFDERFATSFFGWLVMTLKLLLRSLGRPDFNVVVIEIGTDHPGELSSFAWLKPEAGVLTAIAPEHMEFFKTIDKVAEEELTIATFCDKLIFNKHTVDTRYVPADVINRTVWYGSGSRYEALDYRLREMRVTADFRAGKHVLEDVPLKVLGEHSLQALSAATAVAGMFELSADELRAGLQAVEPVHGRMQLLKGASDSVIIDDSYNASPDAVKAALDVLYGLDANRRIAVLGTMNEMGEYSPQAHREVGAYCDPGRLDLVVTIGRDANEHLAPAAEAQGCRVERFMSPYEAGEYLRQHAGSRAAVLVKGSQNQVFAEESVKSILADPGDAAKLVRQSDYWMARKRKQFGGELLHPGRTAV